MKKEAVINFLNTDVEKFKNKFFEVEKDILDDLFLDGFSDEKDLEDDLKFLRKQIDEVKSGEDLYEVIKLRSGFDDEDYLEWVIEIFK